MFYDPTNGNERDFLALAIKIYLKEKNSGNDIGLYKISGNFSSFNPFTTNVTHYIETSHLICILNQLTGFYIMGNIGR